MSFRSYQTFRSSRSPATSALQPRPSRFVVGLSRFELLTPRLSSVCSNQLSYRPERAKNPYVPVLSKLDRTCFAQSAAESRLATRSTEYQIDLSISPSLTRTRFRCALRMNCSRKEVIQPQVLLQLPCYDFTPITDHTLSVCLPYGLAGRFLVQPAFVM